MIYENSRYEFDKVIQVQDHTGALHPAIYVRTDVDEQAFYFAYRIMLGGSRLDLVAANLYKDSEKWWVIARANPEIFYPDDIPMGTILRIPYAR